ncbi:uncharacterized protein LOC113388333 [Ctenocephalides felis]|uniref:uncharacterized protein LOC113388333 n=1 Tax=Ctenocephalides felis TaxID=7515 RepID=UPI000E6E3CE7|nr:uncharacterized protein LOC113388333 [Ctenocephalides felis]
MAKFETSDGQSRMEEGELVGPDKILTVKGSYSYTDPNGNLVEVSYIADDKGFRIVPESDTTVSLRIPAAALASLLELDDQKKEIRNSVLKVTEHVTQNINRILEEKLLALEEKYVKLKEIVDIQEKRIYFLEKQARQRNIVIFGIEELESSYETLQKHMLNWLDLHFSIKLTDTALQVVRRLGKKGDKPRPTLISFSNLSTKINILKQKKTLRDTCYYIKEDYPKQILKKRRQLQEQLKIERENGNMAFLKYDKLVIPKQTSKRKFSASPSKFAEEMSKERITQTKKNKPQH